MNPGMTLLELVAIIVLVVGAIILAFAFNYWLALPLIVIAAVIGISRMAQKRRPPEPGE